MPQVGFEPTIPVFEREKTVHALDRPVTVIGANWVHTFKIVTICSTFQLTQEKKITRKWRYRCNHRNGLFSLLPHGSSNHYTQACSCRVQHKNKTAHYLLRLLPTQTNSHGQKSSARNSKRPRYARLFLGFYPIFLSFFHPFPWFFLSPLSLSDTSLSVRPFLQSDFHPYYVFSFFLPFNLVPFRFSYFFPFSLFSE
jgi:hypothetical protein